MLVHRETLGAPVRGPAAPAAAAARGRVGSWRLDALVMMACMVEEVASFLLRVPAFKGSEAGGGGAGEALEERQQVLLGLAAVSHGLRVAGKSAAPLTHERLVGCVQVMLDEWHRHVRSRLEGHQRSGEEGRSGERGLGLLVMMQALTISDSSSRRRLFGRAVGLEAVCWRVSLPACCFWRDAPYCCTHCAVFLCTVLLYALCCLSLRLPGWWGVCVRLRGR